MKPGGGTKQRRPPAGEALREVRADGWFRAAPGHPWLDPAVTGDPAHRPALPAVGVDGKERRLAKAGGQKKVHLLAAITHGTGLVISQDKVARAGKANETTHFKPLLEPLPLHATCLRKRGAHYVFTIGENQPKLYEAVNALPWQCFAPEHATADRGHGRVELRTITVLPATPQIM